MVFRRRMSSARPIQRVKHVVDSEGTTSTVASITSLASIVVQRAVGAFVPTEVVLGNTVNALFITVFAIGSTGAPIDGSVNWYIAKRRAGQDSLTDFPEPGNTGISQVRNQIFHEEKGVPGSGDGTPMVFKGVIAIPKGMRRFREGDSLFIKISNTQAGGDSTFCIKAIYNEFS